MTKITHLTVEEGGGQNRRRIHLREISGDSDAPLETVGQDLRAARLRRGDDLATVSRALKIRKDHLEALEEDRLEALPGTHLCHRLRAHLCGLSRPRRGTRCRTLQDGDRRPHRRPDAHDHGHRRRRASPPAAGLADHRRRRRSAAGLWRLPSDRSAGSTRSPAPPPPGRSMPPQASPPPAPPPAGAPPPASTAGRRARAGHAGGDGRPQQRHGARRDRSRAGVSASAAASRVPPGGRSTASRTQDARVVLRVQQATRILVQGPDGTVYINRDPQAGRHLSGAQCVGPDAGDRQMPARWKSISTARRWAAPVEADKSAESLSLDPQAIADRNNKRPG